MAGPRVRSTEPRGGAAPDQLTPPEIRYLYQPTPFPPLMAQRSALLSRVIDVLADFPSPEAVMDIRTSDAEDARLAELAARNEAGTLTFEERIELEHYRVAEHMVRMAKARAYRRLMNA